MVNSDKGITNFHSPSDVIVDASMPAMIRSGGQMWGGDGNLYDCKAVIPESTFARIYQEIINFCKWHGNFDPATMGTVPNVGLMAQKAEEYGSHDKTFEASEPGMVRITDIDTGEVILEKRVESGDIFRMCQTKDAPIQDWVKLAVRRARESETPVVFWLDPYRPHEHELIKKIELYLQDHDTEGLDIQVKSCRKYVLCDIRWKELHVVLIRFQPLAPLMAGGGLFETGAGGSAPKHVQQLVEENHLRWDSLGEFLAIAVSIEELGNKYDNQKAKILAATLDTATERLLENNKSPSRKVGQLDNRGSHFYLCLYWAEELANQSIDSELAAHFKVLFKQLSSKEDVIVEELNSVQGKPVDIGGYYMADPELSEAIMRPSQTFNAIIDAAT